MKRIARTNAGRTRGLITLVAASAISTAAQAMPADPPRAAVAEARLRYEVAGTGEIEHETLHVTLPPHGALGPYFSEPVVRQSAALVNFVAGLEHATGIYFAGLLQFCEESVAARELACPSYVERCADWEEEEREYLRLVCLGNGEIAQDAEGGLAAMEGVLGFLTRQAAELPEGFLAGEVELAGDIETAMAARGSAPPYRDWGEASPGPSGSPRLGKIASGLSYSTSAPSAAMGGSLGVTPGGPQDIGILRSWVAEGYVPLPTHLAAEGFLSEHDLPLAEGEPCTQLMCVRSALARQRALDTGRRTLYLQLGFSSGLDAATFRREPLNLAVVVDRSGSMQDHAGDHLSKMDAVKDALEQLVAQLGPEDLLSIVIFNSEAEVLWESAPVASSEGDSAGSLHGAISSIWAMGGTNIEAGLRRGFEIVAAHSQPAVRSDRVILLTDALPNVGETGEDDFLTLARRYGDQGIGLTTLGVGVNFGQELALGISQIRGGNFFFLEDQARIEEIFAEDFDYLVTPVAYDFRLTLEPGPGFRVRKVHGVSSWNGTDIVEVDIATLFLSRNRGAIVIELERRRSF